MNKLEFCHKIKIKDALAPQFKIGSWVPCLKLLKPFITVLDLVCSTIFFKRIIHPLKTFCGFSTHFFLNNCKCSFLHVEKIRGNDLLYCILSMYNVYILIYLYIAAAADEICIVYVLK